MLTGKGPMHYFSIKVNFLFQGQYFTQWLLKKTTNISFITLVNIFFPPHMHIEIVINPICSGKHYPFHSFEMLFIWIFFSTLLPKFSRKICILGCFSQLRYRGGEIRCSQHSFSDPDPQRDGTHFMYSTWNQCSPQPQPPILLVIQVLCKLPAANIVQHRLKTQTEILAFQETPGKKILYILFKHTSSAVLWFPTTPGPDTTNSSLLCTPKETPQTHARSSSCKAAHWTVATAFTQFSKCRRH